MTVLVWQSHYAVGRSLGFVVFPQRESRSCSTQPTAALFEFGLRLEFSPVEPSYRRRSENSSSHGLPLPTAHEDSKVYPSRALPARFVPPSGFGYPLDGFLPSNPCQFCFTPTALLGFALRSFPPSQGIRAFPPKSTHGPFHLGVFPPPKR